MMVRSGCTDVQIVAIAEDGAESVLPTYSQLVGTAPAPLTEADERAYEDIRAERERQIAKGRTPEKDDQRSGADWEECLALVSTRSARDERTRMVKVGSVAVAAIQSIDRLSASRGDIPVDVRAQPSEPVDDVPELWEAFRPLLRRVAEGDRSEATIDQLCAMWKTALVRGQLVDGRAEEGGQ